jgi:hypothetical protein
MFPFRTLPDPIDRLACERCGHPVWDHYAGDDCDEHITSDIRTACRLFAPYGFEPASLNAIEQRAFHH